MERKILLHNNTSSLGLRITQIFFFISFILLGVFNTHSLRLYYVFIGILWLILFFINSPRYSYLSLMGFSFHYKKSFFHKERAIPLKSLKELSVLKDSLILNTENKIHKIDISSIKEYDAKNIFPSFLDEIKNSISTATT